MDEFCGNTSVKIGMCPIHFRKFLGKFGSFSLFQEGPDRSPNQFAPVGRKIDCHRLSLFQQVFRELHKYFLSFILVAAVGLIVMSFGYLATVLAYI